MSMGEMSIDMASSASVSVTVQVLLKSDQSNGFPPYCTWRPKHQERNEVSVVLHLLPQKLPPNRQIAKSLHDP